MINDLRKYILEDEFKISYYNNKLNIVNYKNIDHFDDDKIMIRHEKGLIIIKGKQLIINKMLKDEILISGKVENIELKW